jgi:nucleoside-diphosphate-sugar epimerase
MDVAGKKVVVIGGAGLIGSHTVDRLVQTDAKEIVIYDNFVRGREDNLAAALRDPRVRVFDIGGDITQPDILNEALKGADGVFHFAALWLLQCHEFPRAAFDVNVRGTFNVMEACIAQRRQTIGLFVFCFGLWRCGARAHGRRITLSTTRTFTVRRRFAAKRCCALFATATN